MRIPQRIFYDELRHFYSNPPKDNTAYLMTIQDKEGKPYTFDVIKTPRANLARVLEKSKLFLIEHEVIDDLASIPHETDYREVMYLPFPRMFFEFTRPLEIMIDEDKSKMIKGMMIGRTKDVEFEPPLMFKEKTDDDFNVYFFNQQIQDGAALPDAVYLNLQTLPEIEFVSEFFSYKYHPDTGISRTHSGSTPAGRKYLEQFSHRHPEIARESFQKLLDLCVNTVTYINADNAVLKTADRNPSNLDQINRKRKKKNKKIMKPFKPVNWIYIKPVENNNADSPCGRTLNCSHEVRGHFQSYWSGSGEGKKKIRKWIKAYERGPRDSEHRNSRYKLNH